MRNSTINSQLSTIGVAKPLRLRHLPYPRSARQRRTLLRIHFQQHTTLSQKTRLIAQTAEENIATSQPLTNTFPPLAT